MSPSSRARAPRARRAAPSAAPRGTGSTRRRVSECGRPCAPPELRSRAADIRPCRRSGCRSPGDAAHRRDRRSAARASAERRRLRSRRPASRAPRSTAAPPCPHCRGTSAAARLGNAPPRAVHDATAFRCDRSARRASRSASSMCAVSSASSRPVKSVVPLGKRREQQRAVGDALRAGQRDDALPRARSGARSSVAESRAFIGRCVAYAASVDRNAARRLDPVTARSRGAREHRVERRAVAMLDRQCERVECGAVRGELGQQRIAIGERDVAPHFRRAAGDAREVAKAAACIAEIFGAVLARRELGDEREREQVRQMRHRGENAIVPRRDRAARPARRSGPELARPARPRPATSPATASG